ncbi:ABC transporter substrate-binding protein [Lapillicoccus sp.]|uniref:ABC transporter substrate-binding protein n=1 Tax=Lapillicoccus sp. TaxID=1909287 RepID=UPI0025D8D89F|nr:ABC transporter substrate-binding protein [Lapillicoccus sp.]
MSSSRVRAGAAVGAAIALTLSACTSSPSPTATGTAGSGAADAAAPATFQTQHKGGDLKLLAKAAGGTLDPQVNYTLQYWQLYQAMYDGLLAFKKVNGQQSFTVVPDLAQALPTVSNGGKTYSFTLRKGVKFSNGQEVTVTDVAASFKRIFTVSSPTAGSFYSGIVGAAECVKTPATCDLSKGVVVDKGAGTVVINLIAPDPELKYKLSVPHASILPANSPPKDAGSTPIPTTGPYMIASYDPNTALTLVRNPSFTEWSHDAQPQGYSDTITESFGLTVEAAVTAVENGQADWVFDPPPADRLQEIGTKYANQAHINTLTAMWYLPMNHNLAPFDNVKARQAVNWAVDRNAVVKLYGGAKLAQPVCTFLPPGFPGHADDCQYTAGGGTTWTAPDLAKAKQLVQESGTAGMEVGIVTTDDEVNKSIGQYLQSLFTQLGWKATLKPISANIQFTYIQNTKNKVQISLSQWYQDYPAASDFLNVLTSCASFTPGSDSSINISGLCDKAHDATMQQALVTVRTDESAANAQWAAVDKQTMSDAVVAPLFTPKLIDFVSSRVGNYQFSKQFYMQVSQLWTK